MKGEPDTRMTMQADHIPAEPETPTVVGDIVVLLQDGYDEWGDQWLQGCLGRVVDTYFQSEGYTVVSPLRAGRVWPGGYTNQRVIPSEQLAIWTL